MDDNYRTMQRPLAKQPANKPSPNSQLLDAERAAVLATQLFGFYPGQELAANPEAFLAGVTALFCQYPPHVVEKAVSPVFGLPSKTGYAPRLNEIKDFLDKEMVPIVREQTRQSRLMAREPEIDRSKRLTYDELKAKYPWDFVGKWKSARFDWSKVKLEKQPENKPPPNWEEGDDIPF